MSPTHVVVLALSSSLVLGACGPEPIWNDLTSRELYAGWGSLSREEAVARCDSVSNRELGRGEALYAVASGGSPDSMDVVPLMVGTRQGFRFTDSQEMKFLSELRRVDSGEPIRIHARPFFETTGPDHCYWSASALRSDRLPAILSSGSIASFRDPGPDDVATLRRLRPSCVLQGDYPPAEQPPCSRPTLFAVSDLDSDGLDEFWFTVPTMWDTGFQVAELKPDQSDLVMIASACLACD